MDALSPPTPQPAHFEPARGAWILSRYADVLSALHDPALLQEQGKQPHTRAQVLSAIPSSRLAEWQPAIERMAGEIIAALPENRRIDLLREVLRPWTQEIAILALRDGPARKRRLQRIVEARDAPASRLTGKLARARFELFFRKRPGDKSAFIGISETLPAFLANAWLALLRHPAEFARLRAQPELMPAAIEELLRYAGLVHSLARRAAADTSLAGVSIAAGDRVILKLASANRDPQQFSNPNCLDLSRRASGHLALGHGERSCIGAMPLRAASAVITRALVERFASAEIEAEIDWRWGDTLVSPAALPVVAISQ
jgi:cytochrome P450